MRAARQQHATPETDVDAAEHTSLLTTALDTRAPLHVSLSRSLSLAAEARAEVVAELQHAIRVTGVQPYVVIPTRTLVLMLTGLHRFDLALRSLRWAANDAANRYFLVATLERPSDDALNRLLGACNGVARQRGLPELYVRDDESSKDVEALSDASDAFHISLAWSLQPPPGARDVDGRRNGEVHLDEAILAELHALRVPVAAVKLRMGSDIVTLPLGDTIEGLAEAGRRWMGQTL